MSLGTPHYLFMLPSCICRSQLSVSCLPFIVMFPCHDELTPLEPIVQTKPFFSQLPWLTVFQHNGRKVTTTMHRLLSLENQKW